MIKWYKTKHYARQEFILRLIILTIALYGLYQIGGFYINSFQESLHEAFVSSIQPISSMADDYNIAVSRMDELR